MSDSTPDSAPTRIKSPFRSFAMPLAVILFIALVGLSWMRDRMLKSGDPLHAGDPEVGQVVSKDFSLKFADGKGAVPLSILRKPDQAGGKKVVLVNFWATWCGPCLLEIPSLVKLRKAYLGKGLEVALVNLDDSPETALPPAIKKFGIDFATYIDPEGGAAEVFNVHGLPLTVLIDQDGKILHIESGARDWNDARMQRDLAGWLKI